MKKGLSWLGTARQWHWVSSALCLAGMLLFALTGITLNHAGRIEARPTVVEVEAKLPPALLDELQGTPPTAVLPPQLAHWLQAELGVATARRQAEWESDELYISLPQPGGDAWLSIDLDTGEVLYEHTDRGWIAWLNDLHKGRNTGPVWALFIDLFAAACVLFSLTGLLLLQRQARQHPTTWPLVGLGVVVPILLALLFIH